MQVRRLFSVTRENNNILPTRSSMYPDLHYYISINDINSVRTTHLGLETFQNIDTNHNNILHVACKHGSLRVLRYLLDNLLFELISENSIHSFFNAKNILGQTPIYLACANGYLNIVKLITGSYFGNCIDIEEPDLRGLTPLLVSWKNRHRNVAKYLITELEADHTKSVRNVHVNVKVPMVFISQTLLEHNTRNSFLSRSSNARRLPRVSPLRLPPSIPSREGQNIRFESLPRHFKDGYLVYLEKEQTCPICYDPFEADKIVITKCFHIFCQRCFALTNVFCPMCRIKIK